MESTPRHHFTNGFLRMLPTTTGVIPFGAVMGTVFSNAKLSFSQSMAMNTFVYAGASQLAAVDLMTKNAASIVVLATGLIINLRFLLYSAAMASIVQKSNFWVKLICAHSLTDQGYAVMSAHQDGLKTNAESLLFYFGASLCMLIVWQASVVAGFVFGNFAPASWSLDYAVPLSFASLVVPTLKNYKYVLVAVFSSCVSLLLNPLPYKIGLIITTGLAIILAASLTKKQKSI